MRRCLSLMLSGMLAVSLAVAPAAMARQTPTAISTDGETLQDDVIAIVNPVLVGKGSFLGGLFGKVLNLPQMAKIQELGFLANAMSMDAFQCTPDEPGSYHMKTVLPYLKASKEMQDSLKLRRTARQIKFQLVSKLLKENKDLPEDQKQAVLTFLSQQVGAPMIVMAKSPLPSFIPEPGPCMMPIGVERVEPKSGKRIGLETSAICVLDIEAEGKKIFSVKDAIDNDTLDLVLCHENGHAIMFDMYGKKFADIQRVSTNGHDAPYITDLGLGFIEGWAEAFEAVYGPANPKLKEKDRKKYNVSEFLFGRQDPIRRDRYIWARPTGKKTGIMKNGAQLMATEGVIAGQFYDILTNRAITAPFDKCVSVFLILQPQSYPEFINGFVKMFPDDRKVLLRIVLEGLNYVPMDNGAAILYQAYYQTKLDFLAKKGTKEDHEKAKKAFVTYKEDLYKKAMDGAALFANVGPQMWFEGKVAMPKEHGFLDWKYKLAKKMGKDPDVWEFRLDLNTITAKALKAIGLSEADADKVVAARQTKGFFSGDAMDALEKVLGAEAFKPFKAKATLANFDLKSLAAPAAQMASLWPEDLEKFPGE